MSDEAIHTDRRALVLSHGDANVTDAVMGALEQDGWAVVLSHGDAASAVLQLSGKPVGGAVYIPGLLSGETLAAPDPASILLDLVEALQSPTALRVVAIGSRDWLGWPTRPRIAAHGAGLIAAVRSLALAHGRAGTTINAVIGMPAIDSAIDSEPAPGTHLYEPVPLTGEAVTPGDVAAAVAFFLDERSTYITGQVLHCCGGASLLSSMSV